MCARLRRVAPNAGWALIMASTLAAAAPAFEPPPTPAPPVSGLHDELAAYFDRDITQPPFFKRGREFFYRTRKGEEQAKVYTRLAGSELLLFDPIALDPSGKTSVGAFVLNRDASRAAVATYSRGSEITDYRVIDTRTGAQIGAVLPGIAAF